MGRPGDGFYEKYFYSKRANEIISIDINETVILHAKRVHADPCITYLLEDILEYKPKEESFDLVTIRGAIEHFSKEQQKQITQKAYNALKPGGYFCGDTPVKTSDCVYHSFEWETVDDGIGIFNPVFKNTSVWSFKSSTKNAVGNPRETIFWRCKK